MIAEGIRRLINSNPVFAAAYYGLVAGFTAEGFALLLNAVIAVAAPSFFGIRSLALATGFSGILIGAFLWYLTGERNAMIGPMMATAAAGYIFNPWTPVYGVVGAAVLLGTVAGLGYVMSDLLGGALFASLVGLGAATAFYVGLATASLLQGLLPVIGIELVISSSIRSWALAVLSVGSITGIPLFTAYYAGGLEASISR